MVVLNPDIVAGDAIDALSEVADEVLPEGYGYEFGGLSRQEVASGNTSTIIFALSILFVFLFLQHYTKAGRFRSLCYWPYPLVCLEPS